MALKCPECGNENRFFATEFIDYYEVEVDGDGERASDVECYYSERGDGSEVKCPECGHEGGWGEFEEAAER